MSERCNWESRLGCIHKKYCTTRFPDKCIRYRHFMKREKEKEKMDETLTVTKANVIKAAETCSTAKRVLSELFPTAFEPEILQIPYGALFYKVEGPRMEEYLRTGRRTIGCIDSSNINNFYMLAHALESKTYYIIGLKNGFPIGVWEQTTVFKRPGFGSVIPIPSQYLREHNLVWLKNFR